MRFSNYGVTFACKVILLVKRSHNPSNRVTSIRIGGSLYSAIDRRYFSQGEQRKNGSTWVNYFYSRDHLGSIREVVKSSGGTNTLVARYDYDPYGKRLTQYQSSAFADGCDFGYTGHVTALSLVADQTELVLTHYRAYDPNLGRWLSADPLGEAGGLNLYAYVDGNPIHWIDPNGLYKVPPGNYPDYGTGWVVIGENLRGIHYERNLYNKTVPNNSATQMSPAQSVYHTQGTRCGNSNSDNTKHILPDGSETVYDRNGNFVTDPVNMVTFNYVSPNRWYNYPGHFVLDMVPYYILGNSPDDPTNFWQGINRGFGGDGYTGDTSKFYPGDCP